MPGMDRQTGARRNRGTRLEIQRIGHRQRDRVIVQRHGQAAELAQEPRRERFGFGRYGGRAIQREQRDLQLLGQRGEHVARGDEAQVDQNLAELFAARSRCNSSARSRSSCVI